MTVLGIRYLMGTSVSSDATRQRAEFPPHFGRVYMSLAAAHFENGADKEEREALEWLEKLEGGPAIAAPEFSERRPSQGRALETFVPVNDKHGGISRRSRQARSFPTVRLFSDSVFLMWNTDTPATIRPALERLCSRVTRIGHSSSLVQMWLLEEADGITPTLEPDEANPDRRMRVAEPGTLASLESAFKAGQRPKLSKSQGYRRRSPQRDVVTTGVFKPNLIVFEPFGEYRVLGLESTLQLTGALRNAAMSVLPEGQMPEWLSGHSADGRPSLKPHVAFLPLPFVHGKYPDGHVMGIAMAVPENISDKVAQDVIGPMLFDADGNNRDLRLWQTGLWEWNLRRLVRDSPRVTLRSSTWTEPSRTWASVTPVVLHHYPKRNREQDVARIIVEAFQSAGFPAPISIEMSGASWFKGAPLALAMPKYSEGATEMCRYQTHVIAHFADLLQGPMLVGRGRYRGYGLFRPITAGQREHDE